MIIRGIDLAGRWPPAETQEVEAILKPLPSTLVEENPHFDCIIRRSVLTNAPPDAPGHSKYEPAFGAIVVFDKGVYHGGKIDPEQFRRSIYHELAHSIIRGNPDLLERWTSETDGDSHVDDYAKKNPEEDFADTFSEFLLKPRQTASTVPKKAAFVLRYLVPKPS